MYASRKTYQRHQHMFESNNIRQEYLAHHILPHRAGPPAKIVMTVTFMAVRVGTWRHYNVTVTTCPCSLQLTVNGDDVPLNTIFRSYHIIYLSAL